jgi:hypothetical protein
LTRSIAGSAISPLSPETDRVSILPDSFENVP